MAKITPSIQQNDPCQTHTHQKNDIIEINFILFFHFSSVLSHPSICVNKINLENCFFSGILRITSYLNGRIQKKKCRTLKMLFKINQNRSIAVELGFFLWVMQIKPIDFPQWPSEYPLKIPCPPTTLTPSTTTGKIKIDVTKKFLSITKNDKRQQKKG